MLLPFVDNGSYIDQRIVVDDAHIDPRIPAPVIVQCIVGEGLAPPAVDNGSLIAGGASPSPTSNRIKHTVSCVTRH